MLFQAAQSVLLDLDMSHFTRHTQAERAWRAKPGKNLKQAASGSTWPLGCPSRGVVVHASLDDGGAGAHKLINGAAFPLDGVSALTMYSETRASYRAQTVD